jgi:hypothetical protein
MTIRTLVALFLTLVPACRSSSFGEPTVMYDVDLRLEIMTPRNGDNAVVVIRNNSSGSRYFLSCGTEPLLHMQFFANGKWNDGPSPACLEGGPVQLPPGQEQGTHVSLTEPGIYRFRLTVSDVTPFQRPAAAVSNALQIR